MLELSTTPCLSFMASLLWVVSVIAISTAIQDWLASRVALELIREGATQTVLSGIISAFAWPATLVFAAEFIDSKWSIAINRSDKAGKMLADVLLEGLQGSRLVTLVGFSLGARVVIKCLQELAHMGNNEGIVERVVLVGAPVSVKGEMWEPARKYLVLPCAIICWTKRLLYTPRLSEGLARMIVGTHCEAPSQKRESVYYLYGDQAHAATSHQIHLSKPIISVVVKYREWLIGRLCGVFSYSLLHGHHCHSCTECSL